MNKIDTMSQELINEFMLTFAYHSKKCELYDLIYPACLSTVKLFVSDNNTAQNIAQRQTLIRMIELEHFTTIFE